MQRTAKHTLSSIIQPAARMSAPSPESSEARSSPIHVEFTCLPPIAALQQEWRQLEARSECSMFTSWTWIGCWIELLEGRAELRLLRALRDGRTVGLGLLAKFTERRHGVVVSRTLRLHATGRPELDILTIECNGFLVERDGADLTHAAMIDHLLDAEPDWDEAVFDGLSRMPQWPAAGLRVLCRAKICHHIDLAAVRANRGEYLSLLGRNTRSKIRRSIREFEKLGSIQVRCAADSAQALEFLDGLKSLHQLYWIARGQPGAFAKEFFDRFHRRLVTNGIARGEIQLLAIDAGEHRLGYVYNFVHRGRVCNYQTGFNYDLIERHSRPGLIAHACSVTHNAGLGHRIYDLLAGDARYKRELGTAMTEMFWVVLQRNRVRFRLEDAARSLRQFARR